MPAPVTSPTFYFTTSAFPGTNFGGTSTSTFTTTDQTTNGWNVGANAPPNYAEMNWNTEVVRNAIGAWTAAPSASIPNQSVLGSGGGNCWVLGPFNGEFTPGNWIMTMSFRAVSATNTHTNRIIYRVWTSPTASGQNATLVSPTFFSSSAGVIASTTVRVPFTSSITLPSINLRDEYIFLQTYCMVVTAAGAAGANNADMDHTLGSMSYIQPTPFVSHSRQNVVSWLDL